MNRSAATLAARGAVSLVTGIGLLVAIWLLLSGYGALFFGTLPGLLIGAGVMVLAGPVAVRATIRARRKWLLVGTRAATPNRNEALETTARRVAAHLDRPTPELRVSLVDEPLAYGVHWRDDPTIVLSKGLLATLPADELEAVVAHELAHVANGDHRLMSVALVPLTAAETLRETCDERFQLLTQLLVAWGKLSVGVFSRGREFAADRAAVEATGDPAALAAALERLDEASGGPPPRDLREHARSTDALNVLPTLDPERDAGGGLFATHPATEERIVRLRELARRMERDGPIGP